MFNHQGYVRVLSIIIPYFFVVGFFQFIGYGIAGVDLLEGEKATNEFDHMVIMLFTMLGTILVVWLWNDKVDGAEKWKFKIDKLGIKLGLAIPLLIMLIGFFSLILTGQIQVNGSHFSWTTIGWSILLFLFVSIAEEVIMRQYVLRNLMISFHPAMALVISSLLFSLMHFLNPSFSLLPFINLFLAGVFLGTPYIFNRNLSFPIAGHFAWNFVQGSILGFDVSGRDTYSIFSMEIPHNTVWNGGAFGFEGSILCIILQLIGILIIGRIYKRRYQN
ncbi:CPBP family intramembrane glutamic endopeptidase [Ekhidna sp.]|uniref:CPBP family intramembrane glutamic endopeptidase n=1 Tax=Ekhidna sp. TaxID=2608089 RepID=UPI003CCBA503